MRNLSKEIYSAGEYLYFDLSDVIFMPKQHPNCGVAGEGQRGASRASPVVNPPWLQWGSMTAAGARFEHSLSPSKPATLLKAHSACTPINIMCEEGTASEGALD
jgi:hypothetical protein